VGRRETRRNILLKEMLGEISIKKKNLSISLLKERGRLAGDRRNKEQEQESAGCILEEAQTPFWKGASLPKRWEFDNINNQ
jgi:hypothetical protein